MAKTMADVKQMLWFLCPNGHKSLYYAFHEGKVRWLRCHCGKVMKSL